MSSAKLALAMAGAVMVAAAGLTAGPAHAATASPHGCPYNNFFQAWNGHRVFLNKPGDRYSISGDAGITLTMTVSAGTSVTTQYTKTWGSSTGVNAGAVSASAHADVSRSIQKTVTNSVQVTGSYRVQHFATLHYGAWGYAYQWERAFENSACKVFVLAKGTAMSPAHTPGFHVTGS